MWLIRKRIRVFLICLGFRQSLVESSQGHDWMECQVQADGIESCTVDVSCKDELSTEECEALAATDKHCIASFDEMRQSCAYTCGLCHYHTMDDDTDPVLDQVLPATPEETELLFPRIYAVDHPQIVQGAQRVETYRHLRDVDAYMYETVYADPDLQAVREHCQLKHPLCTFWAMCESC